MNNVVSFAKKYVEKKGLTARTCSSCINNDCPIEGERGLSLDRRMVEKYGFCAEHISRDEPIQPYCAMEDLILTEDMLQ
jgi:hypothetical protein